MFGVTGPVGPVAGLFVPGTYSRTGGFIPQLVGVALEVSESHQRSFQLLHVGSTVLRAQVPVHRNGSNEHEHRLTSYLDRHRSLGQFRSPFGRGGHHQDRFSIAERAGETEGGRLVVSDIGADDHVCRQLCQFNFDGDQRCRWRFRLQRSLIG